MAAKADLDLHTPVSKLSGVQRNKKLKGSVGCSEQSINRTVKKNTIKSCDGSEDVGNDPNQLDSLTVQELKTIARSKGVSAKGNKKQLISALKCFYSTKGADLLAGSCTSTPIEDEDPESMPPKRKAKSSLFKDNTQDPTTLPDSSKKKRKSTSKKEFVECAVVETDSKVVAQHKECSSSTQIVEKKSGSKLSKSVSTRIQSIDSVAVDISSSQPSAQPWTVLAHKKPQKDWVPYNPNTMRPPPLSRDTKFVKLMSWNVNGLRALLKLESFSALELAQKEDFDVLCLQETKIQEKDVEKIKDCLIDGYDHSFWTCSITKLGYSGTAVISRIKPISVKYGLGISDHDSEGRLVTVEFDSFFLLCGYVPNSGDGLRRLTYRVEEWDRSLGNYMKELEKLKPVILTGDLNCAHQEIDIYDPAGNRRSAGFTIEERESFERNFLSRGFVDTFRKQHPGVVAYTYWGYRHGGRKTNKGWRLDYFLASDSISDKVYDSYILPEVIGSDHCPIGLILKF